MLFQMEAAGSTAEQVIALFWRSFEADADGREYAETAVRGVGDDLAAIDAQIGQASAHWRLERMTRVDRNILRLGTWELLKRTDVPRAVILDEAVELAKAYGTEDSSAFVNGVLNKVADMLGRKDEDRGA